MKKYFNLKLAVMSISIFAFLSFPVMAENDTSPDSSYYYCTVNIGSSKLDYDLSGFTNVDDSGIAYSLGIGYVFNDYIAIEVGWLDLGEFEASTSSTSGTLYGKPYTATGTASANASANGVYLGPIFSLPVTEKFKAYAKIGGYVWFMDAEASTTGSLTIGGTTYTGGINADADGKDLYFGFGASYDITEILAVDITEILAVRTDWTRYEVSYATIDVYAVGVVFKW